MSNWELLLIDNASGVKLADEYDLSWHPCARHIREGALGLTPARLRGISEAKAGLLVFVDDDNILELDYLETAVDICHRHSYLGAWSGTLVPEFETPPPSWTEPFHSFLGIRVVPTETWARAPVSQNPAIPYGAGLCVRAEVANAYASACVGDSRRRGLGRKGTNTVSAEDIDLAMFSCDMGLGTGLFPALRLVHLMPRRRLELDYLVRLAEGTDYSLFVLRYIRDGTIPPKRRRFSVGSFMKWMRRRRLCSAHRSIDKACERGAQAAFRQIVEWQAAGK